MGPLLAILLCASGCAPETPSGIDGLGDAGTRKAAADAAVDALAQGFVMVSSDYDVTTIGLLKLDGTIWKRELIHSGSATAGLVTALSGDVLLPTQSDERGVLTLIDRFRTDVVTRIDLSSGDILGQVKTNAKNSASAAAYSSNPHDYVFIDDHSAWVSRYNPNVNAKSGDPDVGIDLLRLDPTRFTRTADRIDFSGWNQQIERVNPKTRKPEPLTLYARPSGMVRMGNYLAVGVDVQSATFDAAGDAMVALVDLNTKTVRMLKLPGMQNCGDLAPVPDDASRVAVSCVGFYRGVARDTAGLAMLVRDGDELRVENLWRAKDHPESALTIYGMQPLGADEVLATAVDEKPAIGDAGQVPTGRIHDRLFRVSLKTGEQDLVFEADGSYVIGGCAFEPRTRLVLVPDASADAQDRPTAGIRRFKLLSDGSFREEPVTRLDEILPARQIRLFR
jgi:hypothetical protein